MEGLLSTGPTPSSLWLISAPKDTQKISAGMFGCFRQILTRPSITVMVIKVLGRFTIVCTSTRQVHLSVHKYKAGIP